MTTDNIDAVHARKNEMCYRSRNGVALHTPPGPAFNLPITVFRGLRVRARENSRRRVDRIDLVIYSGVVAQ